MHTYRVEYMRSTAFAPISETIAAKLKTFGDSKDGTLTDLASRASHHLALKLSEGVSLLERAAEAVGAPKTRAAGADGAVAEGVNAVVGDLVALLDLRFQPDWSIGDLSAKRISKTLGSLRTAQEATAAFEDVVFELAYEIAQGSPSPQPDRVYLQSARAVMALRNWEYTYAKVDEILADQTLAPAVLAAVTRGEPLRLTFFVCPPSYFPALQQEIPTDYFPASTEGSFLRGQVDSLRDLTRALREVNVPFQLTAVIGDTDETDYLWPVLGTPQGLQSPEAQACLAARREAFQESVAELLKSSRIASEDELCVVRLSAIKGPFKAALESEEARLLASVGRNEAYFTETDWEREEARMRELWTARKQTAYYEGLPLPSDDQLRAIVGRKFASYALEGVLIERTAGLRGSILIQLEQPGPLRNRMLSAGRELLGLGSWPAILRYPVQRETTEPSARVL